MYSTIRFITTTLQNSSSIFEKTTKYKCTTRNLTIIQELREGIRDAPCD